MSLLSAGRLAPMAACAVAATLLVGLTASDAIVRLGYAPGSQTTATIVTAVANGAGAPKQIPHAGDEGFWLSRADAALATSMPHILGVGDRITLTTAGGTNRVLEVVDVRPVEGGLTAVGHDAGQPRLVMITCKADDGAGKLTRFIVEDTATGGKPLIPAAQKVL